MAAWSAVWLGDPRDSCTQTEAPPRAEVAINTRRVRTKEGEAAQPQALWGLELQKCTAKFVRLTTVKMTQCLTHMFSLVCMLQEL